MIEIKTSAGRVLYTAQDAFDVRQAVEEATRARANLARANLVGANLVGANLVGANLAGANLARANLANVYLANANLAGAKGLAPERVNDLLWLRDQVGKIRAYKLTDADANGPYAGGITYEVGQTYEVTDPDTNPRRDCGAGINLAILPWCLRAWREGYRIFVCEFTARDIAAIPIGDGKFRVGKAKVVREIPPEQIREWLRLDPPDSEKP
ncbi:MAG: pentapeptide repeat-containing protein [Thermoleophilaceae bacterium]